MATGFSVDRYIKMIGHFGSRVIDPNAPEPANRIGHHVQECLKVAHVLGRYFTPFDFLPTLRFPCGDISPDSGSVEDVLYLLNKRSGVITGMGLRCGHAVAFERGIIFDPDGLILPFDDHLEATGFSPQTLWVMCP